MPELEKEENQLRKKRNYYTLYSVLFLLIFFVGYLPLIINKKLLLWEIDGTGIHYPYYLYFGRWVREILRNLFISHTLEVPMWDYSIGYGADIPTSLFTVMTDPLNWTAVFVPEAAAEYVFSLMIVVRMYLAGISFSYLAHQTGCTSHGSLLGALLYALGGYMIISTTQWAFLNPMILFPLLILETDRCLKGKNLKRYILILSVCILHYFYFAYMMAVLVILYCIIWFLTNNENRSIRNLGALVLKFLTGSVIAGLISSIILLPTMLIMTSTGRLSLERVIPVFFSGNWYLNFFRSFFSVNEFKYDVFLGFTPFLLLGILLLFLRKKERFLKTLVCVLTVMMLIPWVGHFMNGMQYVTIRWSWGYVLCLCYVFARVIPDIYEISRVHHIGIILFFTLSLLFFLITTFNDSSALCNAAVILIFLLLVYMKKDRTYTISCLLYVSCSVSLVLTSFFYISCMPRIEENAGEVLSSLTVDQANSLLDAAEDTDDYRYDSYRTNIKVNSNMLNDLMGFTFYNNIYNDCIDEFHTMMAIASEFHPYNYKYVNLDCNPILTPLLGTKYFIVPNRLQLFAPFHFRNVVEEDVIDACPYCLLQGDYSIPLGYLYQNTVSEEHFNTMTPIERQQTIMTHCVLENTDAESRIRFSDEPVPYTGDFSDNHIRITDTGMLTTLVFDKELEKGYTYYLYFDNLQCTDNEGESYSVNVHCGNVAKSFWCHTTQQHIYGGKHTWLLNLGTAAAGAKELTLEFSEENEYFFDELSIIRVPEDIIRNGLEDIEQNRLIDAVILKTNRIECSGTAENGDILFLSVPYSSGWTATVNGKKAEVERANIGFMAVHTEEGQNEVVLRYHTPGLAVGTAVSAVGIILYLFVILYYRKNDPSMKRGQI